MKYTTRYISPSQEKMILSRIDSRIEAAVLLALYCGAKRGEIMQIRQSDIDTVSGRISIKERSINITKEESERLMRAIQSLHCGLTFNINAPIYVGYNSSYLSSLVRQHCASYGLEGVGLRELRHTAVIRRMEQGASMGEVQMFAGYADYTTAFQIYSAVRKRCK